MNEELPQITSSHYTPSGVVERPRNAFRGWGEESDYKEVLEQLNAKPEDFMTQVMWTLVCGLKNASASITGIHGDQWFGIAAEGTLITGGVLPQPTGEERFTTWVECDTVEWGIAATLKLFIEHYGLERDSE